MRRIIFVVAAVTALFGAPSAALAAPPNQLSEPAASATTGVPGTVIVLTVTYRGHPAETVTAEVAGLSWPMSLVSGTATEGRWSVSVTLEPGTWPVVFRAAPAERNVARIEGPSLTVVAPTPVPARIAPPAPAPTAPPPAPTAPPPAPTDAVVMAPVNPGPVATSEPRASAAASTAAAPAVSANPGAQAAPVESQDVPPPTVSGEIVTTFSTDDTSREPIVDQSLVQLLLVFGLLGVAGVAIVGSAWLAAARRRQPEETEAIVGIDPVALARRAQRRRGERGREDPIIEAMGLTDPRRRPRVGRSAVRRQPRRPR